MSSFEDVLRAADQAAAARIAFIRARVADMRTAAAEHETPAAGRPALLADANATESLVDEMVRITGGDWIDAGEEVIAWSVIDLLADRWSTHPDFEPSAFTPKES